MKQGCKSVLMVFLGIFLGFLLTLGGIALGGYWAYQNLTINKVEQLTGSEIIDLGELNNKPIKDLITEISNISNMTVKDIDEKFLSGSIKKNLVIDLSGEPIDLTQNLFKDVFNSKIGQVTDKLPKIKDNLTFGFIYNDILLASDVQLPENSPLLEKYKDKSLEYAFQNIGDEKIETLYPVGHTFENQMLNTVFQAIKTITINETSDSEKLDNALNSMGINSLLGLTEESTGVLGALQSKNWSLGELKAGDEFDSLNINEILNITTDSDGALGAIAEKNWTLGDLKDSENFKELNIGKILNITETTGLMGTIKDWTLGQITSNSINDLTLGQVITIDSSSISLLKALQNCKLKDLNTEINNLSLADALDINGEKDTGILAKIKTYNWTLGNFDSSNLNQLVSELTIQELVDFGIISIPDWETKKDTNIGGTALKEFTIPEFIEYSISII